jgi:para-nitrobenzyl esterase
MRLHLTLLLFAMLPGLAAAAVHQTRVQQGTLDGIEGSNGVAAFLGVPYAAAPVGNLRWRRPGAPAAWHGARRADRFAANCMQQMAPAESRPWTSEYLAHGKISEDCLFLNIWTPDRGAAERLPVLVWIHEIMELGERFAPRSLMPADELQTFRSVVEAGGRITIH